MDDSSNQLERDRELTFSQTPGFFDKSVGVRVLIGIVFTFSLFMILHFREVWVEVLELNSIAPSYIVAQTDFDFYDEEATIILKQEAIRNIGKVYQISDKEIRQKHSEFDHSILTDNQWREQLPEVSIEEIYKGTEALEKTLLAFRFTDPKTLRKIEEAGLPTIYFKVYTPLNLDESGPLPKYLWNEIKNETFPEGKLQSTVVDFIMRYFMGQRWKIEEDISSQRAAQKRIQGQVSDKYTHIGAGSRIIDQGEKVTTRHIAMLQAMKEALSVQRHLWQSQTLIGSLLLAILLSGVCAGYFFMNYPRIATSNRKLSLVVTVIILTFIMAKITEFFFLSSHGSLTEIIHYPLFVPFSAILLCSLIDPAIATFTSAFLTIVLMITLAFDTQGFVIMNITAALVAVLSARSLIRRKEIFIVCAKAWLACIIVIISLYLYQNTSWVGLLSDIFSAGGFLLMTAVLVVGLLPLLEAGFRMMTDVTLMEYMDPNHDLLRRLSIEAPGTYQHSVIVGNLAEAAALAIGANGLFCRVATLYHDVGKMSTPQYFTENQSGGMNIHQLLTPQESAQVIIAHVAEGVMLAREAGLPEQFINVIQEHHGTTLVYYFYRQQVEKMGGDKSKVDQSEFRYNGPKPRTKESVIIMIADSLEAASRSLEKVNEESVLKLTTQIIKEKAEDGQFDRSVLTLEELAVIKETLVKTLVAYGHSRVKYPKRELGEETLRDDLEGV